MRGEREERGSFLPFLGGGGSGEHGRKFDKFAKKGTNKFLSLSITFNKVFVF